MDDVTLRAQLVDEASKPLEDLGKTATTTAGKIEKSSKREASAAEKAAAAVEGSHKRTRKSYSKTEDAAAKAGAGGGKKFGSNMADAVDASKSKAVAAANKVSGKMADALKSKAGAIGASVGALIGGSIVASIMSETASIDLQIKTGTLDGKANKNMGESMDGEVAATAQNLYNRGFGEDQAAVNGLVDSIARIPGVWDEGVTSAASFGSKLSVISGSFEQEAGTMGQTIETLMANGMASNAGNALDMITKTMQDASPLVRDEILENVTEYAKHYEQMGFSSEEMFGLILKGSENGVIGVDKMGDAVKELGNLAISGSDGVKDAYKSIGEDADAMATSFAAGGESAQLAFDYTVEGLKKIEDPAKQAQTAIALFGAPLEDLGTDNIPAFLDAMDSTKGSLTDFEGVAQRAADAVEQGPGQSMEVFKRSMLGTFQEIGANAMPYLMPLLSFLTQFAPILVPMALGLGGVALAIGLVTGATAAWNIVLNMNPAVRIIMLIIGAIALLVAGFLWAYENVEWFRTGVDGAVNGAKAAFEGLGSWWNNSFMPILQAVGGWFKQYLIDPISSLVGWIGTAMDKMGGLSGIMSSVGSFMSDPLGGVRGALGLAGGGVVPGYAPGVDSVPAMLSPGEAVLVPELASALGADWIYSMNAAYSNNRTPGTPRRGGGTDATENAARYAGGGIALGSGAAAATLPSRAFAVASPAAQLPGASWTRAASVASPVPVVPSAVSASREFAGNTLVRPEVRESSNVTHNNVTIKIQGSLATGITLADVEAAVHAALAENDRRAY